MALARDHSRKTQAWGRRRHSPIIHRPGSKKAGERCSERADAFGCGFEGLSTRPIMSIVAYLEAGSPPSAGDTLACPSDQVLRYVKKCGTRASGRSHANP